jgi:hypothetical protein
MNAEEFCIDQIAEEDPTFRQLVMGILKSFIVTAPRVSFSITYLKSLVAHSFPSTLHFTLLIFILIYRSVAV